MRKKMLIVQVHRRVKDLTCRVVIDHFEITVDWPQLHVTVPGELDSDLIDVLTPDLTAEDRVKSVGATACKAGAMSVGSKLMA